LTIESVFGELIIDILNDDDANDESSIEWNLVYSVFSELAADGSFITDDADDVTEKYQKMIVINELLDTFDIHQTFKMCLPKWQQDKLSSYTSFNQVNEFFKNYYKTEALASLFRISNV